MKLKKIFLFACCVLFMFSCNKQKKDTLKIQLDWFLNSSFCGEVVAKEISMSKENFSIDLIEGGELIDPIKVVSSGEANIGVISSDNYLKAISMGMPLKLVGIKNPISPVVFISKKELNIKSPQDFKGKKIGLLLGGSTTYIYKLLLIKNNLNNIDFTEYHAPYDINTFILGRYDVRPAFVYDEPVTLEQRNIDYSVIKPIDYGINFVGGVYFTTEEFYEKNKELVYEFQKIISESWEYTFNNQEEAIQILLKQTTKLTKERELKALEKSKEYFISKDGIFVPTDVSLLQETLEGMRDIGEIKNEIKIK